MKLEHTAPPLPESKHVTTGRKEKYTNAHLPLGAQDNSAWRRIFIPTYLQYLAGRDTKSNNDAWAINDNESVSIQQKIWDFVYGDKVPHIISVQGPVFALVGVPIFLPYSDLSHCSLIQVDQRVCEWRSGFASAALSIVNAFFDHNEYDSDNCRQEFAASALKSWAFLYREVAIKDGEVSIPFLEY